MKYKQVSPIFQKYEYKPHQILKTSCIITGPTKIIDGLFVGDEHSAKDIQFVVQSKITHIINVVSKRVPNMMEKMGVQYLSLNWNYNQNNIFDKKNVIINKIYAFIQEAAQLGQSCLIHSISGKTRALTVVLSYLMKKFQWSLDKTIDLVSSKKKGLNFNIRQHFLDQLSEFQLRLARECNFSQNWKQSRNDQQLIIRNTYINTIGVLHKKNKSCEYKRQIKQKEIKKSVIWSDKINSQFYHTIMQKRNNQKLQKSTIKPILKKNEQIKNNQLLKQNPNDIMVSKKQSCSINLNNFFTHNNQNTEQKHKRNIIVFRRPLSSRQKIYVKSSSQPKKIQTAEIQQSQQNKIIPQKTSNYDNKLFTQQLDGSIDRKNLKKYNIISAHLMSSRQAGTIHSHNNSKIYDQQVFNSSINDKKFKSSVLSIVQLKLNGNKKKNTSNEVDLEDGLIIRNYNNVGSIMKNTKKFSRDSPILQAYQSTQLSSSKRF